MEKIVDRYGNREKENWEHRHGKGELRASSRKRIVEIWLDIEIGKGELRLGLLEGKGWLGSALEIGTINSNRITTIIESNNPFKQSQLSFYNSSPLNSPFPRRSHIICINYLFHDDPISYVSTIFSTTIPYHMYQLSFPSIPVILHVTKSILGPKWPTIGSFWCHFELRKGTSTVPKEQYAPL